MINNFIVFACYSFLYSLGYGLAAMTILPLIEIFNDNLKWKYIIGFILLAIISISLIVYSEIYKAENIEVINSFKLK